jgi:hypothetical protein
MVRRALFRAVLVGWLLAAGCADAPSPVDERIDALFGDVPFGTLNREQAARMLTTEPANDAPFHMVNLIRHREHAEYRDGRPTEATGAEADALYGSLVLPILLEIGARPVFVGNVERSLIDRDGAGWSQVAVVLYPSRAAFVAMLARPDFRAAAEHKIAGVERTIVLVTSLVEPQPPEDLRRVDLSAVPYPPTADDPPVTVAHVLDFNDRARYADGRATDLTGREAFALYEQGRIPQALPLGVRPGIALAVDGELIGDGRPWEELRVNNFPSRATLEQLVSAESLDRAGVEHREAALADTYALLAAPVVSVVGYLP